MYKIIIHTVIAIITISVVACKKENLKLVNPNLPVQSIVLKTEDGVKGFALGIINRQLGNVGGAGGFNMKAIADIHHSIMGDEQFSPYGNFGMRWSNQVHRITLPNGTVVLNPIGVAQKESIQAFNSRDVADRNVFQYDWNFCYSYIIQCNMLLAALENPELAFSGNAATKKDVLKAWALWWKGFAYSRLGSLYIGGIINDKADGSTNGNYVVSSALIAEANKQLDAATTILNTLTVNADYNATFSSITPTYNTPADIITPDMWKRQINTLKARNMLVNKKVADMTAADWTAVIALVNSGVQSVDKVFMQGLTADGNNDVAGGFYHPYVLIGETQEFLFVSERLIQDYKPGDNRLAKNFYINPAPYPANIRSRGLQFGTRWAVKNVESGGSFATANNTGLVSVASTYEENRLMAAEALIHTNQIEQGLQIIDEIRNYQNAGIAAVAGTGLNKAAALEELRRERRVALFMRGLAFYDARRWGIIAPASQGGGRANAVVYLPSSLVGGGSDAVRNCFMEYNYMEYFDVPLNEVDFNAPAPGSAPIKN
jgi:starch-binding outer membrane protein, SusD/RagB family